VNHRYLPLFVGLTAVAVCSQAAAAEPVPASEPEPEKSVALDVGVGISSAYVWRGYNLFQDTKQMDQNAMVSPSLTLSFPATGLSIGYWGAYQLNGENKSMLVDAGVGAEQDLILGYELSISDQLTAAFGLTYYFYPMADENVAGTSMPSYIEPAAGLTYSTVADLGLAVAYFHGLQEETKGTRHVYISPSVAKSFEVGTSVAVEPSLSFGYKIFNESAIEDNVYDVLLSVGVPIAAADSLAVTPSVNAAWTNLTDVPGLNGEEKRGFGDEYVVWGGLNLDYSVL
jgi:uncharacterized protein (TIGR02001 family)